ncbi:unnamed protein product [Spodoptera littoralis]|uniref:Uncharacterized protein n=1 Tax=Spodoptera littoralis TaxID=7109 RepID=A0A9P0I360_SPOLI|nr:unnamed protein product [Spodoptera littoralis]CAH1639313.1 unnamed protein product [Spodoptera littoralis]
MILNSMAKKIYTNYHSLFYPLRGGIYQNPF